MSQTRYKKLAPFYKDLKLVIPELKTIKQCCANCLQFSQGRAIFDGQHEFLYYHGKCMAREIETERTQTISIAGQICDDYQQKERI